MGKSKKSKCQTKQTVKTTRAPSTKEQDPPKEETPMGSMVILFEINDEIRIMVPFGKKRPRQVMEARYIVAAPVLDPEETIDDIEEHACHNNLTAKPLCQNINFCQT